MCLIRSYLLKVSINIIWKILNVFTLRPRKVFKYLIVSSEIRIPDQLIG